MRGFIVITRRRGCSEQVAAIVVVFISLFIGVCVGIVLGENDGKLELRAEAIEAGVAEWRIDAKTGEKTFAWIECGKAVRND